MFRRLGAILAALALTLLAVVPALAVDIQQTLPISSTSASFQGTETECAEADLEPGEVLWHFVLNQTDTDQQTLTATFQNAGIVTVSPSDVVDHYVLHFEITTGADTLTAASTSGTTGNLLLSHICQGGPPPEIPEAPLSALLVLTGGVILFGFVAVRMRRGGSIA